MGRRRGTLSGIPQRRRRWHSSIDALSKVSGSEKTRMQAYREGPDEFQRQIEARSSTGLANRGEVASRALHGSIHHRTPWIAPSAVSSLQTLPWSRCQVPKCSACALSECLPEQYHLACVPLGFSARTQIRQVPDWGRSDPSPANPRTERRPCGRFGQFEGAGLLRQAQDKLRRTDCPEFAEANRRPEGCKAPRCQARCELES